MDQNSFIHYRLGIDHIDKEHWELLLIMEAINSFAKDGNEEGAKEGLEKLSLMLEEHIKAEEELMELIKFPYLLHHKAAHKNLMQELENMKKSFSIFMFNTQYATKLFKMLMNHVDGMDFQYIPFYKKYQESQGM